MNRCFSARLSRFQVVSILMFIAVLAGWSGSAVSASWPTRPVQLIVPFPGGSSPDILARTIAEPLSKDLGQPVIIENRPGAGGNIGTRQATQAKPDGHTLLMTINGPMVTAPTLYKTTLGYDPLSDLIPVSLIGTSPNVLVVPSDLEIENMEQFIALAKANPGNLNYGSVGPGSSSHLAMAMLEHEAGIALEQIPYTGFTHVITAIMGGDIHAGFMVPGIAMPQVSAGGVRALAITSPQSSALLPGIATVASQGYPDFQSISWNALFVPAGTPAHIVERLHASVTASLEDPAVIEKMESLYFTPQSSTPDEMTQRIRAEKQLWDGVIERLGLSLDH